MNIQNSREFTDFVKDIKNRILSSQYEALKKVNRELIDLYWNMRQFYLEYYEDSKLQSLATEIGWTKETNQLIGIATYKLSKDLPQELKEYLPTASEIEKNLVEYLRVLDVK